MQKYRGIHFGNYKSQRTKFKGTHHIISVSYTLLYTVLFQDVMDQVLATTIHLLVHPMMYVSFHI